MSWSIWRHSVTLVKDQPVERQWFPALEVMLSALQRAQNWFLWPESQQLRRHGVRVVYNYADTRSSRISSRKQKQDRETCFFCFYLGPR